MTDWTEKYRPTKLKQILGNDSSVDELRSWAENWENEESAAILHGRPGIGKTTTAHALGNDMGWDVMEMNASDERTGDIIERIAGEASQTGTLTTAGTSGRRLVVLDEADNLHGNADRGGTQAMTDVVKDAKQPIVLIANDKYGMSRGLQNSCKEIEFSPVDSKDIIRRLEWICQDEGVQYETDALRHIAERSEGDVRSAVNDLEAVAKTSEKVTTENITTGQRDRETGIFDFLDILLKDGEASEMSQLSQQVDETPDDLQMWIEHNLPKVYDGDELAEAYRRLGRSDQWLGRVIATQEYTYWKYASDNMTAGVAAARDGQKGGWTRFGAPYGRYYGGGSSTREEIAKKIAQKEGISINTAKREVLPFLSALIPYCKPQDTAVQIAARYGFDESEIAEITGSGKTTNKVEGIVEDAESLLQDFDTSVPADESKEQNVEDTIEGEVEEEKEQNNTSVEPEENISNDVEDEGDSGGEDVTDDDEEDKSKQSGLSDFV